MWACTSLNAWNVKNPGLRNLHMLATQLLVKTRRTSVFVREFQTYCFALFIALPAVLQPEININSLSVVPRKYVCLVSYIEPAKVVLQPTACII